MIHKQKKIEEEKMKEREQKALCIETSRPQKYDTGGGEWRVKSPSSPLFPALCVHSAWMGLIVATLRDFDVDDSSPGPQAGGRQRETCERRIHSIKIRRVPSADTNSFKNIF